MIEVTKVHPDGRLSTGTTPNGDASLIKYQKTDGANEVIRFEWGRKSDQRSAPIFGAPNAAPPPLPEGTRLGM